eukprot:TRINITY_DN6279_c0_g1_i1.p1 TRINITY_DN6279_c0_g1~~TRINITY_DN6279_c0_g1_i1.p1  ORF type:complete len:301 (-),score=14.51 TRINITY_DN6279_c0_g1_i1:65-967(-)
MQDSVRDEHVAGTFRVDPVQDCPNPVESPICRAFDETTRRDILPAAHPSLPASDADPEQVTESSHHIAGDACQICFSLHDDEQAVYFSCGHAVGHSCFVNFVQSTLNDHHLRKNPHNGVFSLGCPIGCAGVFLQDVLVVKALGEATWMRFLEVQRELMIQDQRWVYCPNCNEAQPHPDDLKRNGQGEKTACVTCQTIFCANCMRVGSHDGLCPPSPREIRDSTGRYVLARHCRNPDCHRVHTNTRSTDSCHHFVCECGDNYCYMCGGEFNRSAYQCVNGCPMYCDEVEGECVCPPRAASP